MTSVTYQIATSGLAQNLGILEASIKEKLLPRLETIKEEDRTRRERNESLVETAILDAIKKMKFKEREFELKEGPGLQEVVSDTVSHMFHSLQHSYRLLNYIDIDETEKQEVTNFIAGLNTKENAALQAIVEIWDPARRRYYPNGYHDDKSTDLALIDTMCYALRNGSASETIFNKITSDLEKKDLSDKFSFQI